MLREKIINLILSEKMRNYLTENPDWLTVCGYFEIIYEYSKGADERAMLLEELLYEWDNFRPEERFSNYTDHKQNLELYIKIEKEALDAIYNFDRSRSELLLIFMESNYINTSIHIPVLSLDDARRYIKENIGNYKADTTIHLKLYEINHDCLHYKYKYILDSKGEIRRVLICDPEFCAKYDEDSIIMGYGNGIYIPVPYEAGDIVYVKDEDAYSLILYSEDIGCLNYLTFQEDGDTGFYDWHNGFYSISSGGLHLTYNDIIFKGEKTDKVFTGDAAFVNELSNMIKANPEIGKMDHFAYINSKYPPQELPDILRSEIL